MTGRASAWLTRLGPYFAAASHDPEEPPRARWHSLAELLDEPDVLRERVAIVRARLAAGGGPGAVAEGSVELRVAASVAHLGLAARVLSPLFALGALGLRLGAPVSIRDLRWQPTPGSMFELSLPGLDQAQPSPHGLSQDDLGLLIVELCELMRSFGVSQRVLRGNVASALNGARVALSAAEPGVAECARTELGRVLSHPLLADTWHVSPDGRFRRRSCCLIYRAAPGRRGPLCGDCVLAAKR